MLAEDQNKAYNDKLYHTAKHGEDGGTCLIGIPKGREGKVFGHGGKYRTKDQPRQSTQVEDDLVERGVAFSIGERHIDVLKIGKGHVVAHAREVLRQTYQEAEGDIMPNTGLNKAIHDLQGCYHEQSDGKSHKPRCTLDHFLPKAHAEDKEGAVYENDDVIERVRHLDVLDEVHIQERGVAGKGELPQEYHHHGEHEFFVLEGDEQNIGELGLMNDGIGHFFGDEEEYHVYHRQNKGEISKTYNKIKLLCAKVGQSIGDPARGQYQNT